MDRKRTPLDYEEIQRLEAIVDADDRVAEVVFLTVRHRGRLVTHVVLVAHARYRGTLPTGDYLDRAKLMTSTGARCGIVEIAGLDRTPSGEVDREKMTADLERALATD
jgi:hypothetical protein